MLVRIIYGTIRGLSRVPFSLSNRNGYFQNGETPHKSINNSNMKKHVFALILEFRQAKFLRWEIPVPSFQIRFESETIPKRADEIYEK